MGYTRGMIGRRRFLAGSTTLFGAALSGCVDPDPDPNEPDDCVSRCAEVGPQLLISADELAAELAAVLAAVLDEPNVQLVELRGGDSPGIPGALRVDLGALAQTVDAVTGLVAEPGAVEQILAAAGLVRGRQTVVYADGGQLSAARLAWILSLHDDFAWRLLDGGLDLWIAEGRPLAELAPAPAGDWRFAGPVEALRVDADWVLERLDDPSVALIDARGPTEFGAGHIPGARNVDWNLNLAADQRMRSAAEVAALYPGADEVETLVCYCHTGARASMAWLALRWLGRVDVRLYDGSWVDWTADASRPIAG